MDFNGDFTRLDSPFNHLPGFVRLLASCRPKASTRHNGKKTANKRQTIGIENIWPGAWGVLTFLQKVHNRLIRKAVACSK
ncbi:hypothetical protein OI18_08095 [Flavihumibacter solisilvae]|uniref:Uncharacterized protein n=1 Tax=Flavihumibacter solisilvae TaxID=1349421 RepID=A0A0C1IL39_9BACT|nr:hypothetical protein OI18_08095 [Flavihumibacter solisilvae]